MAQDLYWICDQLLCDGVTFFCWGTLIHSQIWWSDHLSSATSCHERPCLCPPERISMQIDTSSATSCLTRPGRILTQIVIFTDINVCRIAIQRSICLKRPLSLLPMGGLLTQVLLYLLLCNEGSLVYKISLDLLDDGPIVAQACKLAPRSAIMQCIDMQHAIFHNGKH